MEYEEAINILVDYYRRGEKDPGNYEIGIECEHFIVYDDTLEAVPYFGEDGIMSLLDNMTKKGWNPQFEGECLIGLEKNGSTVTLEPAGQVELSITPEKQLKDVVKSYRKFIKDIIPFLEQNGQVIMAVGYQPQSSISDIELIPKERYSHMYKHFTKKGKLAHNMMKGTAACHICVDYENEEDYRKKYKVIAYLSPLIYTMFDNTPFFEKQVCMENGMRSIIWDNCDTDRCGLPQKAFSPEFGYREYAKYLLDRPPMLLSNGSMIEYTGDKTLRQMCEEGIIDKQGLLYAISMYFPDIRTRNYIEIRMGDSIPYPYNIGYAAFWKGLLYNYDNLDTLYREAEKYGFEDYKNTKAEAFRKGVNAEFGNVSFNDKLRELITLSKEGLSCIERGYILTLEALFCNAYVPKNLTLNDLNKGKRSSLEWCILNDIFLKPKQRCKDICKEGCDGIACCGYV